jgi:hypothetical protein
VVRRGFYSGLFEWGNRIIIRVPYPDEPSRNNLDGAKQVFFHEWGHYVQYLEGRARGIPHDRIRYSQVGADKWAYEKTGLVGWSLFKYRERYKNSMRYKQEAQAMAAELGYELIKEGKMPQGVQVKVKKGEEVHYCVGWGAVWSLLNHLRHAHSQAPPVTSREESAQGEKAGDGADEQRGG